MSKSRALSPGIRGGSLSYQRFHAKHWGELHFCGRVICFFSPLCFLPAQISQDLILGEGDEVLPQPCWCHAASPPREPL